MLLICSSCNSKYLVNSADLKPNGRDVKCFKCNFIWFQEPVLLNEEEKLNQKLYDEKNTKVEDKINENYNSSVPNLPSTYIKENNPSIINSTIILFFLFLSVVFFWLIKNEGGSVLALLQYYIFEFYFNLKLIINDLAKITHNIIN